MGYLKIMGGIAMNAMEITKLFLKDQREVNLSVKQVSWLSNTCIKESKPPIQKYDGATKQFYIGVEEGTSYRMMQYGPVGRLFKESVREWSKT